MLSGNINIPFPKNLGDPMNADPAPVGFQALFHAFSPGPSRLEFRTPAFPELHLRQRIEGALKPSILADLRYRPPLELRATSTRQAPADLRIGISRCESPRVFLLSPNRTDKL
jgi:hypothetical protein